MTWDSIFTGSGNNIIELVGESHPDIIIELSENKIVYEFYEQLVRVLPYALKSLGQMFFSSTFYIVLFFSIFFVMFYPFFRKIGRW